MLLPVIRRGCHQPGLLLQAGLQPLGIGGNQLHQRVHTGVEVGEHPQQLHAVLCRVIQLAQLLHQVLPALPRLQRAKFQAGHAHRHNLEALLPHPGPVPLQCLRLLLQLRMIIQEEG